MSGSRPTFRPLEQLCDVDSLAARAPEDLDGRLPGRWSRLAEILLSGGRAPSDLVTAYHVPGRIEIVGKHTDYAGGRSLVSATSQGIAVVVAPRTDSVLHLLAVDGGREARLNLAATTPQPTGWVAYPATVARRLAADTGLELRGADVAFDSTLPIAAGMSSSSALVVATHLALAAANAPDLAAGLGAEVDNLEDLAGYLGAVEGGRSFGRFQGDGGVGTFGGSEDHTAILCSRPGEARQYRYGPVVLEQRVEMPQQMVFAVATSGVLAEKSGAAQPRYNRLARAASEAARIWRDETGRDDTHLAAALASGPGARDELRELLASADGPQFSSAELSQRTDHFVEESAHIVPAATAALRTGDLDTFGALVDRSQALAEELLGNQIDETVFLAREARTLGAVAASAFGAGFGGSVWALVETPWAETFLGQWSASFLQRFPRLGADSSFLITAAGSGARELD